MARIPWWVWVGVGVVMYIVSWRVGESLKLFSYVGLFFVVVGIFKLLVRFIVGGKKSVRQQVQELKTQQHACPRCRNVVASSYMFCPHCGTRLR